MIYPRFLLLLPLLLLFTTVVDGAPLPNVSCPSCPASPQASNLGTRGGKPTGTDLESLNDLWNYHLQDLDSLRYKLWRAARDATETRTEAEKAEIQRLELEVKLTNERAEETLRRIQALPGQSSEP
ncbi:hypothetical protein A4X06_0g7464 [Tilletia controversa]|uniref:GDP/GTP exchange factor Sec2 N-terminal domain-containing protein n=1 Tax=Tilletia controversa TaxID=13291 RepID=A0A8X7STX5_9BASI|nr:hypothetical protein CF328_g4952 [Tilletia controversa]KAE8241621.1 hypothetical protein A4X06_0g7464 [Tilletia controversa]